MKRIDCGKYAKLMIPKDYSTDLSVSETQRAILKIRDKFETELRKKLSLLKV